MRSLPTNPSDAFKKRNPQLYHCEIEGDYIIKHGHTAPPPKRIRQSTKPLLNVTEQRYCNILESCGRQCSPVFKQAFTLRLDPPYKSYTPDLAYFSHGNGYPALTFVEVKGPHRFRKAGIAKAALAAKTYPQFRFELADWDGKQFKESVLSP